MSNPSAKPRIRTLDIACPDPAESPPPSATFTFPRKDLELCDWMHAAVDLLTRDSIRYMLAPEQVEPLDALVRAFDKALMLACAPDTRGQQATRDKDAAREAARAAFKPIIDHIRNHAAIDIADKIAIGMKAHFRGPRRPIEPPNTAPVLNVTVAGIDGTHTLRYADERTPHKRRRPKGAGYLELRIIITPPEVGAVTNPEPNDEFRLPLAEYRSERITKPIFTIQHDRAHAGWCATYHARWCTNTNKPGPWNHQPVSMLIAFGGPVPPEDDDTTEETQS